ncbi:UNVERIFIED_CONTAM: hypothetical protein GTU68_022762 [Idotea baltica]|nr:hypothetical protein [Idotea baltica]
MSDILHRFQLENLHVRGEWVSLSQSWKEIQSTTDYPPAIQQVLGEAIVAISLLADSLKFDGSLVLQIIGAQPVSMLVVQATSDGSIRGMANWEGEISPKASFKDLFQAMNDQNEPSSTKGERYQSLVSLEGDSLSDCFAQYFAQSEQLNTRLWLSVNDKVAAGLMLQSLPSDTSQSDGWNHASILADTIKDEELLELPAEQLLHRLYHEEDLRLYDAKPIRFNCTCSQDKIEHAVASMGETEANSIIEEQGNINVDCDFCNTSYLLDSVDVARIFSQADVSISNNDANGTGSVH